MSSRTEKSKEIVSVGGEAPPDWLVAYADEDKSLVEASKYRVLNRLKIIQGSSSSELKKKHGEGAVILSPGNVLVAGVGEKFTFVGLMMFTEWCTWSDINDKASPSILDRSFDPTCDIAKKAAVKETRFEEYEGSSNAAKPFNMRHVEHINIAGVIYNPEHPLHGQPTTLSYARGEFGTGRTFLSACMMRKVQGKQVPLYCQVWDFSTSLRDLNDNEWYGYDHSPPESPYIKREEVEVFKAMHEQLADDYAKNRIRVDHSDAEDEAGEASVSSVDNEFDAS